MRLRVLSDLHFEFHADAGRSFVESLDPAAADVLVVAGDLSNASGLAGALELLCRRFAQVVYVHGNHEFYGSDRPTVLATTRAAATRWPNLHWLDDAEVELGGRRFVGTPLWYPNDPSAPWHVMNDFHAIADFRAWFASENARAVTFLRRSVREGAIVVTHMLPSRRSVPAEFASSPLNPFFVCDVEDVIASGVPAVWIHGHTHSSCDYVLGRTRVVCNPFGYAGSEENPGFDERKVIEV